jgi:hypothetical protein
VNYQQQVARANRELKDRLRADAVDPAKVEERTAVLAARRAKRMAGVTVEVKRKRK